MRKQLFLVVDDLPEKLRYLTSLTQSAKPECEVVQATTARQAFEIIETEGRDAFAGGVIDFDLGGGFDGGDVIQNLRNRNALAAITLATARSEDPFEHEAKPIALTAGANEALSTKQQDFEARLSEVLGTAA